MSFWSIVVGVVTSWFHSQLLSSKHRGQSSSSSIGNVWCDFRL